MLMQFLLASSVLLRSTQAAIECQKYPIPSSTYSAMNCCNVPDPNWKTLPQECLSQMTALKTPTSPCTYECIFNITNTLKNGKYNATNLRPLLSKLYADKVFLELYFAGFEKCAYVITEKTAKPKPLRANRHSSRRKLNSTRNCSPLALKYIMCAHRHVFVNCPNLAWTASAACEDVRKYAQSCQKSYDHRGQNNETNIGGNGLVPFKG